MAFAASWFAKHFPFSRLDHPTVVLPLVIQNVHVTPKTVKTRNDLELHEKLNRGASNRNHTQAKKAATKMTTTKKSQASVVEAAYEKLASASTFKYLHEKSSFSIFC